MASSATMARHRRAVLLGTVAASALFFGYGRTARAFCVTAGDTATCTGDHSGGIASGVDFIAPPVTTLNVNSLTADIAPLPGVPGIYFVSPGDVTISGDSTDGPAGTRSIITSGTSAPGILAVSYYGDTSVTHTGDIATSGPGSDGIAAYAYFGAVTIKHMGNITTAGDGSLGITATSVYGPVTVVQTGNITTKGYGSYGIAAASIFGPVTVVHTGDIRTEGPFSAGIFATGYDATKVSVDQTGTVTTIGDYSIGIVAENYGPVSVRHNGSISTSGYSSYGIATRSYAGPVTITTHSDIRTRGDFADGIIVYSYFGDVEINHTGDIRVTGDGADAIDVNNYYGNSRVTIGRGSRIVGGPGSGDGIDFDTDGVNRLFNHGLISTRGDNAIEGEGSGDDLIDNYGVVSGNVDLGAGANRFTNHPGALFNTGTDVMLDALNVLTNRGTLSPGGAGAPSTTTLTGDLLQRGTGVLDVDIRFATPDADLVTLPGAGTADLDGWVTGRIFDPQAVVPFVAREVTILTAAGGATDSGLEAVDTAVVDYEVRFAPNGTDVLLGFTADFAPAGLNTNQTSVANNVNRIQLAGGSPALAGAIGGLLAVSDLGALANAYDQLGAEIYLDTELAALFSSLGFSDGLFSCAVADGAYAFIAEGQCHWARFGGSFLDRDPTAQTIGWDEDALSFTGGTQIALQDNWYAGAAIGLEMSELETATGAEGDITRLQAGFSLKHQVGPALVAGAISFGNSWHETLRPLAFGGFSGAANSHHDVFHTTAQAKAAYLFALHDGWYAKPSVDVTATWLDIDGFTETGGAGLTVAGADEWIFSASPSLEFGTEYTDANGLLWRPFARVGLTVFDDTDASLAAQFTAAPVGAGGFVNTAGAGGATFDIGAGVDMLEAGGAVMRLVYDGRFGDGFSAHSGAIKTSIPY